MYRIVGGTEQGAVAGNGDAGNRLIFLGDYVVGASVLGEVPDPYAPTPIATYNLALIRMYHDVVDGRRVVVCPLDSATPRLPDLDGTILRTRDHPLALAVKGHARHVAHVALEGEHSIWVGRLDVVELHGMMPCRRQEAFVGGDAEPVDLGLWVLDRPRADARKRLPKPIATCTLLAECSVAILLAARRTLACL